MSPSIQDNCLQLVSLLQTDVQRMCAGMLDDERRDPQRCIEYFTRLKYHEDLLTTMLSGLTLQMRSCHNALSRWVYLPEAVLHEIMTQVVLDTSPRSRLYIAQVCSHWRKRALNIRNIWSGIDLHWKELSNEYMKRSYPLPIDVRFESSSYYDVEDVDFEEHIKLLTPHLHRLRTLAVQIPKQLLTSSLKIICSASAPHLECLIIKSDEGDGVIELTPEDGNLPIVNINNLFNHQTPVLTQVNLKSLSITWDSPLFRGLKVLRLDRCTVIRPRSNILEVIRLCPDLEALHVGKVQGLAMNITNAPPAENDMVHATKLRVLSLHHLDAKELRRVLWRLVLPASNQLSVSCCLDEVQTFQDVFPPMPHQLSNILNLKSLSISISHRSILRGTLYGQGGPVLFTADLTCVDPSQNAEQQIRSVMSSIPFQTLERLTVICKSGHVELPPNLACNVLLATPTIKHFNAYGVYGQDILACLEVKLPHAISTLHVNDVRFTEADVTNWLSKNKQVNLPVSSLQFSHCTGLTELHIERLRNMISEVSWDEEEQNFSWPKSVVAARSSW